MPDFGLRGLVFLDWGHIRCCGCRRWRFRSYSESPFPNAEKVTQKALPRRTALRLGSVFPRYGVHPGASPPVCFAAPPLDGCGFAAWRCAPNPRMNTYARPAEGAEDQKPHQKPEPEPEQIKRSQPSAVPTGDWVYSVGDWSADRPSSRASPLPQLGWVHPQEIGRLSGRHRQQAGSYSSDCVLPLRRSRPTQHNER